MHREDGIKDLGRISLFSFPGTAFVKNEADSSKQYVHDFCNRLNCNARETGGVIRLPLNHRKNNCRGKYITR